VCENYVQLGHLFILKDPKSASAEVINLSLLSNSYVSFDLPSDLSHKLVLLQQSDSDSSSTDFFAYHDTKFLFRMIYDAQHNTIAIVEKIPLPDHLGLIMKHSFDAYSKVFSRKHMLIQDGYLYMLARKDCAESLNDLNYLNALNSTEEIAAVSMVSVQLQYPYELGCRDLSELIDGSGGEDRVMFMQG